MSEETILVREWDPDLFHKRVLDLEEKGYEALRDSYRITAEMNPDTGEITHLHSIEMTRPAPGGAATE